MNLELNTSFSPQKNWFLVPGQILSLANSLGWNKRYKADYNEFRLQPHSGTFDTLSFHNFKSSNKWAHK